MIQDTLRRVQSHKQSVLTVSYWGPDSYEVTSRVGYLGCQKIVLIFHRVSNRYSKH